MAEMAATGVAQGTCDRLTLDTLQLPLARHIGRTYGNADRRRDDGRLHPAALARVIEQLLADPIRSVPLPEMARCAGLGVSAFVRAFRGSVGCTPAAFALKLRLNNASDIRPPAFGIEHSESRGSQDYEPVLGPGNGNTAIQRVSFAASRLRTAGESPARSRRSPGSRSIL